MNHLLNLPTPSKISYNWKFGSVLMGVLGVQVASGVMLCLGYVASADISFANIDLIMRDFNYGDMIRNTHANGASLFFLFLYLHTGRGIYYSSYKKNLHVWNAGLTIFLMSMGMAFLGYVLPWGQMSYWGATVITNLASVMPLIGGSLVQWIWGGFSVNSATLTRFLGLHIMLPLVLVALVGVHMILLHNTGSSNPLGFAGKYNSFHPYWTAKDMLGMLIVFLLWVYLIFIAPYLFMDSENFLEANPLVTPVHIQPEWYFLSAYAVLRSVPNKLGGVIGLALVFFVFYVKPFFSTSKGFSDFYKKLVFWVWGTVVVGLTWMGSCSVEGLYMILGQVFTFLYFFLVLFI